MFRRVVTSLRCAMREPRGVTHTHPWCRWLLFCRVPPKAFDNITVAELMQMGSYRPKEFTGKFGWEDP